MSRIVCALAALVVALAWVGDAAAADVELTKVGNDPQNVWCDTGARQLAQGATLNVQILGRGKKDAPVVGKIRMKSQTDKFEWASGEPTVTFTRTGSSPTSFGVKAKSMASVGTHSIAFAAVDARNSESSRKSCSIEVTPAPADGAGGRILPGRPGVGEPPLSVVLSVSPPSSATSLTSVTLRAGASGGRPEIETPGLSGPQSQCQYKAVPTAGGEQRESQWDVGCLGWTTTLAPGTYTLQATYRKMLERGSAAYSAQVANYVVAAPRVISVPAPTKAEFAQTFSLKLGIAPASGQATSDNPLTIRLLKEGTWNPPSLVCTYAAIPSGGGNPWSTGPGSTCAVPSPTLVAGAYTISLKYRYQKQDGSWGDGSSEVDNYVVTPAPRVEVVSLWLEPAQPVPGQQATVKMTIKNSAAGSLARVPWTFVKNNVGLRSGVQMNVPAGNTPGNPFEVTASFTAAAGMLGIAGHVDYANELREPPSERGNNARTLDVMVAAPPLPTPHIVEIEEVLIENWNPPGWYADVIVCNVPDGFRYRLWRSGTIRKEEETRWLMRVLRPCPSNLQMVGIWDYLGPKGMCEKAYMYEVELVQGQRSSCSSQVGFRHPGWAPPLSAPLSGCPVLTEDPQPPACVTRRP